MAYLDQIKQASQRRGVHHRINAERFFNIDHLGWFYYQRGTSEQYRGIELHVGVVGPFKDCLQATQHLAMKIQGERAVQRKNA